MILSAQNGLKVDLGSVSLIHIFFFFGGGGGEAEIHVQCVVYNRHVSASLKFNTIVLVCIEQPNFQCVDICNHGPGIHIYST